jgi:hypothetical protein
MPEPVESLGAQPLSDDIQQTAPPVVPPPLPFPLPPNDDTKTPNEDEEGDNTPPNHPSSS